jgi:lysophospholipase L1-like esterase
MTRAFIIGDSHSVLLGPAVVDAARGLGWTLAGKVSHVGWSTAHFVSDDSWLVPLAATRPDVAVVILGTNDAAQSQQAYAAQLQAMVDAIKAAGVENIVWVGPPSVQKADIDARIERIAPWQQSFLPQMGVRWIDSRQMTGGGQAADGVHFTRAGYMAWASSLADTLASSFERSSSGSLIIPLALAALVVGMFVATLRLGKAPRAR